MNQHAARLSQRLAYALVAHRGTGFFDPAKLAAINTLPWRRYAKFGLGGMLLAVGALTGYQQLVVRVSREAVINARVATIRAPMDGIISRRIRRRRAVRYRPACLLAAIEDPAADDARVFQLQQDMHATKRERDALSRRLIDLRQARAEADSQAEAYRVGRVRQDELRVEEARAMLAPRLTPANRMLLLRSVVARLSKAGASWRTRLTSVPCMRARWRSRTRSRRISDWTPSWSNWPRPAKAPISATITMMSPPRSSGRAN